MADSQPDLVPRPDPTALTTEQLRRELGGLRELLESKIDAVTVRIDGIDTASTLLRSNLEQIVNPGDVTCLKDLLMLRIEKSDAVTQGKFERVQTQLEESDKRSGQLKVAADSAVTTAMTAAEKAVTTAMTAAEKTATKSENTTGEAIKNLDNLFKTEIRATNDKVSGIASRQDRFDGSSASLVAIGSGALAVMSLLIAAYVALRPTPMPPPPQPVVQYVPAPTALPVPAPVTVPR